MVQFDPKFDQLVQVAVDYDDRLTHVPHRVLHWSRTGRGPGGDSDPGGGGQPEDCECLSDIGS